MKRLLFLSTLLLCLVPVYGQFGKTKKAERIPVDSTSTVHPLPAKGAQEIDGSKNGRTQPAVQTKSINNAIGGQVLKLPVNIGKDTVTKADKQPIEPKSVYIERERSLLKASVAGSHEESTFGFFRETPQLHIPRPEKQIRIHLMETDYLGITLVRGIQVYRDIPVYGMDFTLHISAQSERFLGCTVDTAYIDNRATQLTADDAVRIAEQDLGMTTEIKAPGELMKTVMGYGRPTAENIYYPVRSKSYRHCYKVVIRPNIRDEWIYYIDALNGEILEKFNNTPSDGPNMGSGRDLHDVTRTVNTYLENGAHYMVNATKPMFNPSDFSGVIGIYDVKNDERVYDGISVGYAVSSSAQWNNPQAVSAMYYTSTVYDYLQSTFNRKSFDNKGSSMMVFINMPDEDGTGYDNAFWNGQIVALGNGDYYFHSLAGALDIIAHEFGHAVISSTAKLEYKNQSGAVNEAYADIFGAMVDRKDWTIGEDVIKSAWTFPSGAMRDMSNPHNGGTSLYDACWQPVHVSEMYLGSDDNGGVHTNNSIPAHAFYIYAVATSKERAEQVFYRALTNYLTPTSKFIDLRQSVIQSAKDLGFGSDEQTIAGAFDRVGVVDDTIVPTTPDDLPTNPGEWGLLICNTDPDDNNSLYKMTDYYAPLIPLTTTEMISTPSITDDGKYTIFVDDQYNIIRLDMTTGVEEIFNDEGDNQSVAISRDGKRIAVITTYEDSRIYVFDVDLGEWTAFRLYNPTTGTGGAKSGGPRYADAIEFDHTGEYLLYDAYNVVGQSLGSKEVDHWDIGLINVWDNSKNTWGTGEIVKLFSDLTPGLNVFNPVFSKNSPYIIAFDYYDEEDDTNAIVGVNLNTGDVDVIHLNVMASYPSYSMDDSRIAFNSIDFWTYDYAVAYKELGSDKISPKWDYTDEDIFVTGGAFPVYYGTGTRQMGVKPAASFTADARTGAGTLDVQFLDMSEGNPSTWSWTFQGGSPATSGQQHPRVSYHTPGTYPVRLVATNSYGSDEIIRQDYITVTATGSAEFVAVTGITGVAATASANTPLTLTATVSPADATNQTIVWSVAYAGTTGATISGNTLNTTAAGTTAVRATIAGGETASTPFIKDFAIKVSDLMTGAEEFFAPDLKAYPNPFNGALRITGAEGCTLRICNSAGVIVYTSFIASPDETLRLERLPDDAYILIFEKSGKTKSVKVIKN